MSEALEEQRSHRGKAARRPLGRILVERGVLDEDRLACALADLGVLVLSCPDCGCRYRLSDWEPEVEYSCHECGQHLELRDPSEDDADAPPYYTTGSFSVPVTQFDPSFIGQPSPARAVSGAPGGADRVRPARDPFVGKVFGGCRVIEKIAAGGMGVVYKARQLNLDRVVALKILSRDLSSDESFVKRFLEEARSAARLNHGKIVHINDVGDYHGIFYFTMEFVDGITLKTVLKERCRLSTSRSIEILLEVCDALKHAHGRGIIHRDIKPENIMITREGHVKLADLGLAKKLTSSGVDGLTQAGSVLGTPYYMPPEQAKDFSRVDERSDIYSLGVTFVKMLSGQLPFTGRTPIEVMIKVIDGRRPDLRTLCADVPDDVIRIAERMIQTDPADRFQSVDELVAQTSRVHPSEAQEAADEVEVELL